MNCGNALPNRCGVCGHENPAEAKFCMNCGNPLGAGAPAPAAPPPAGDAPPEERRQVTVLFADLSGYTAVSERMDPESVKALVDRALGRLVQEVKRFGGTVDKFIGDNVMALWGAPVAHEDDAERAVRAALGMQAAMGEVNAGLPDGVTFALRVGVNSGEVLAGAVGDDYTVTGDTVNVASRLQSAARPGTVVVGERTFRASHAAIRYDQLEPLTLKGKAEPVPAWEAAGTVAEQAVGRAAGHEVPLVGRDYETGMLESLHERVVREGRPHLVTLIGEAGVGKSRLLREFERRLDARADGPTIRTGRSLPYGSGIVYWALSEVVRDECGIDENDTADEAWHKLLETIEQAAAEPGEVAERRAAVIGRSLGLEVPGEVAPADGDDPERMRDELFSALRLMLEASAERRPLVVSFEDIHWADEGMLDAIEYLAQWVRAPLMLVCLTRGELLERRPTWGGGRRNATQLFLEPLTDADTRELVAALLGVSNGLGANGSSAEVVPAVAERSGGNPLFAEEMVRRISEEGAGAVDLPDSVQAVLAARLDALEPFERRLVQQASVVGRTFWASALATLAATEGKDLDRALMTLQEKDILAPGSERSPAGEREFAFKHVLIRDVAYGMLPRGVRSQKHFEVGRFIEERAWQRSSCPSSSRPRRSSRRPCRRAEPAARRRRRLNPRAGRRPRR